jgi:hypothetical protein
MVAQNSRIAKNEHPPAASFGLASRALGERLGPGLLSDDAVSANGNIMRTDLGSFCGHFRRKSGTPVLPWQKYPHAKPALWPVKHSALRFAHELLFRATIAGEHAKGDVSGDGVGDSRAGSPLQYAVAYPL